MTLNLPEYVTLPAVSWIRRNHATMRGPAGCGGGYYKSLGSCEMCGKHTKYGRPGPGYIYRETGEPVGESVLAQIRSMNDNLVSNTIGVI